MTAGMLHQTAMAFHDHSTGPNYRILPMGGAWHVYRVIASVRRQRSDEVFVAKFATEKEAEDFVRDKLFRKDEKGAWVYHCQGGAELYMRPHKVNIRRDSTSAEAS